MADNEQLPLVADAICRLRDIGFQPVLVAGMALVIMGSLRVTRDFDFVIAHPADRLDRIDFATRVRIDLLLDFPLPAKELAKNAKRAKILSHLFDIASPEDLLRLKEPAWTSRSFEDDAQDIEFLKRHLGT